jgi:hypothetical protein
LNYFHNTTEIRAEFGVDVAQVKRTLIIILL